MFSETLFNFMFTGPMSFGNPPLERFRQKITEVSKNKFDLRASSANKNHESKPCSWELIFVGFE